MEKENLMLLLSFLVTYCVTSVLTLIPVWHLIIIPGIIAGFMNKSMRRGILVGSMGILVCWLVYSLFGMATRNTYTVLNQIGALIFGTGFGWLFLVLILLIGAIFGLLGAMIGNIGLVLANRYLLSENRKSKSIEK
ncbi:MAG: hypothetical protein ACFE85_01840 [Candidatus Hodarchaeota archaeon]